jgi:hypothetical protein
VFSVLSIAALEGRHAAVVDIGSTFLNAKMKTGVDLYMCLDRTMSELMTRPDYEKYMDSRGCMTVVLDLALVARIPLETPTKRKKGRTKG